MLADSGLDEITAAVLIAVAILASLGALVLAALDLQHSLADRRHHLPPERLLDIAARTNIRNAVCRIIAVSALLVLSVAALVSANDTEIRAEGIVGRMMITIIACCLFYVTWGGWRDRRELEELGSQETPLDDELI